MSIDEIRARLEACLEYGQMSSRQIHDYATHYRRDVGAMLAEIERLEARVVELESTLAEARKAGAVEALRREANAAEEEWDDVIFAQRLRYRASQIESGEVKA